MRSGEPRDREVDGWLEPAVPDGDEAHPAATERVSTASSENERILMATSWEAEKFGKCSTRERRNQRETIWIAPALWPVPHFVVASDALKYRISRMSEVEICRS